MRNLNIIKKLLIVMGIVLSAFLAVSCIQANELSEKNSVSDHAATVSALWTAGPIPVLRTPYPPPTKRATITAMPSNTPMAKIKWPVPRAFATATIVSIATEVSNPIAPQYQPQDNCSIYADAKAQYKRNVAYYKSYYTPMIQLYQSWIDQDVMNRDALALSKDTALLNREKKALSDALADQKKQYSAVVPKECR